MMSKHTPGEWVTGSTDPLLFGRKQGNGTEPIGFVYGPSFPERSDVGQQALANARLIAAAPENYACNVELAKIVRELCATYNHPLPQASLDRSDAAISKVEAV